MKTILKLPLLFQIDCGPIKLGRKKTTKGNKYMKLMDCHLHTDNNRYCEVPTISLRGKVTVSTGRPHREPNECNPEHTSGGGTRSRTEKCSVGMSGVQGIAGIFCRMGYITQTLNLLHD
jgi:hypothetical protein